MPWPHYNWPSSRAKRGPGLLWLCWDSRHVPQGIGGCDMDATNRIPILQSTKKASGAKGLFINPPSCLIPWPNPAKSPYYLHTEWAVKPHPFSCVAEAQTAASGLWSAQMAATHQHCSSATTEAEVQELRRDQSPQGNLGQKSGTAQEGSLAMGRRWLGPSPYPFTALEVITGWTRQ